MTEGANPIMLSAMANNAKPMKNHRLTGARIPSVALGLVIDRLLAMAVAI